MMNEKEEKLVEEFFQGRKDCHNHPQTRPTRCVHLLFQLNYTDQRITPKKLTKCCQYY